MGADRDETTQYEPHLPEQEKISYGDRFAQTEEMSAVSQPNDELQELPRSRPGAREPMRAVAVSAELPPAPERRPRGEPIGSLPVASEAPPKTHVAEVLEDAQRHLGVLQAGLRDITAACWKLARLPIDVAVFAARQLRPLRA